MAKKTKDATPVFGSLQELADHLRSSTTKNTLVYAHNGTGKTRLSMAFKDAGRDEENDTRDTLYFNAYTEDLFSWDNDLKDNKVRVLKFNKESHFFDGLEGKSMEEKIRPFLHRYVDFNFNINYKEAQVVFWREEQRYINVSNGVDNEVAILVTEDNKPIVVSDRIENIKISRGEENIFIWCFFLAIAEMAIDGDIDYKWVKYIYVDDPISSLDDNNAVAVASHLCQLIKREDNKKIHTIISTHHGLFFNVIHNELNNKAGKYFLNSLKTNNSYSLIDTKDTPFFHHIVLVQTLQKAIDSGELYTYHFNMLRNLIEKTAAFHGFSDFRAYIKKDKDDEDGIVQARRINILSHGNYSLFDPKVIQDENKEHFKKIFKDFIDKHNFNEELFKELEKDK